MLQIDGRDMKAAEQGMTDRNRFWQTGLLKIPAGQIQFDHNHECKTNVCIIVNLDTPENKSRTTESKVRARFVLLLKFTFLILEKLLVTVILPI